MRKLINGDISNIIEKIIPVLKPRQSVVGAYLFGSVLEEFRPDSDIDLGLLLAQSCSEKEAEIIREEILMDLPLLKNHPFDMVILNHSSAIFAYKVITKGRLIYTSDAEEVTNFMEIVSRQRAEHYPRYRQALEAVVRGE